MPLTSGEFDLLLALAERPQRVLSRDQLLDLTKGHGAQPFDRSIDVQLSRLRRKVEADPKDPQLIKTVRGGGYVLSACRHSASPRRPGSVDRPMHVVYPVAAPRMLRAGHRSGRVAAVPTPAELRHDLYRQLYFAERSRREQIRSGIAVPVSAIAFSVFAFSKLATHLDLAKWQAPSTILLMLLALGALASVIAAIAPLVRVEWLLVFDELPDLTELLRAEKALAGAADRSDPAARRLVDDQFRDLLTGGYFIAYRRAFMSNGASSTYRAWAVRFIVVGLFLLLLAYMVLPVHMAG